MATFFGAPEGESGELTIFGLVYDHGSVDSYGCAQAAHILRALTAEIRLNSCVWDYATRTPLKRGPLISDAGDFVYRAAVTALLNNIAKSGLECRLQRRHPTRVLRLYHRWMSASDEPASRGDQQPGDARQSRRPPPRSSRMASDGGKLRVPRNISLLPPRISGSSCARTI
jgi:hypothetical protein